MERYEISAYLQAGFTQQSIATKLAVHSSTICRELQRNRTPKGKYSSRFAQDSYQDKIQRLR